jgi:hypothetical protein
MDSNDDGVTPVGRERTAKRGGGDNVKSPCDSVKGPCDAIVVMEGQEGEQAAVTKPMNGINTPCPMSPSLHVAINDAVTQPIPPSL